MPVIDVNGEPIDFPDTMSDEEIVNAIRGMSQPEPTAPVAPQPQPAVDFSLAEMAGNIPSSALQYGKDVFGGALGMAKAGGERLIDDPMGAVLGIGGLPMKAGQMVADELFGGGSAELDNLVEGAKTVGGGLVDHYADRYGSMDAAKRTLMEDPVGAMADVASFGPLMPGRVGKAVTMLDPVSTLTGATGQVANPLLKKQARSMYESASKFPTTQRRRDELIDAAVREQLMPTEAGLERLSSRQDFFSNAVDDIISSADMADKKIDPWKIQYSLSNLKRSKGGFKMYADSDIKAIDQAQSDFADLVRKNGGDVSVGELNEFKRDLWDRLNWNKTAQAKTQIGEDIDKALGFGAMRGVEDVVPEVGPLNREWGNLIELEQPLTRASNRIANRDILGIGAGIKPSGGAVIGSVTGDPATGAIAGATAGFGLHLLDNPKIKARIALGLERLRGGDRHWLDRNMKPAEMRLISRLVELSDAEISELGLDSTVPEEEPTLY